MRRLAILAAVWALSIALGGVAPAIGAPGAAAPAARSTPAVPAYQPPTIESPDPFATIARVGVALALVLALVVGTQRMLARAGALRESTSTVRVREIRRLGPQHTLYVVDAGGRRLLLGANVALVADLGAADEPQAQAPFANRLRALSDRLGRFTDRASGHGEAPAAGASPPRRDRR